MPKDRLSDLQKEMPKEHSAKLLPKARVASILGKSKKGSKDVVEVEMETLVVRDFDVIMKWIEELDKNTTICRDTYKTSETKKGLTKKLKETFKNSENLAHKIANSLKSIKETLNTAEDTSCAEYRMKLVQYGRLVEQFKKVAQDHESWAEKIASVEKKFIAQCHQIVNQGELDDAQLSELIAQNPQIFTQDYINNEQEAKRQLADLEERHERFLAIEQHLGEVRDLFVTLATYVELQQENLERIEHHAVLSTDYVDKAVDQLGQARKSKKKGRIIKIAIVIGVILLILIVLGCLLG